MERRVVNVESRAGERLMLERKRRRWTQAAVGRIAGIAQAKLSQSECGERRITLNEFASWAMALGVDPGALLSELLAVAPPDEDEDEDEDEDDDEDEDEATAVLGGAVPELLAEGVEFEPLPGGGAMMELFDGGCELICRVQISPEVLGSLPILAKFAGALIESERIESNRQERREAAEGN